MTWTTEIPDEPEAPALPEKQTTFELDNIIQQWAVANGELSVAKRIENDLRWGLAKTAFPNPTNGTNRIHMGGGFALKLVFGYNYALNKKENAHLAAIDELMKLPDGKEIVEKVFKWVPEIVPKAYEEIAADHPAKPILASICTITVKTPQLELETPNAKAAS